MSVKIHECIKSNLRKIGIPIGDTNIVPVVFAKDYVPKDSPRLEKISAGTVAYLFEYYGGYGEYSIDEILKPKFFISGCIADENELAYTAPGFALDCVLDTVTGDINVDGDTNLLDLVTLLEKDSPIYIGAMDYWKTSDTLHVLGEELPYTSSICSAIFIFIIGLVLFLAFPFVTTPTSKFTLVLLGLIALISGCLFMCIGLRDRAVYKRAELNTERLPFLVRRLQKSGREFIADKGGLYDKTKSYT